MTEAVQSAERLRVGILGGGIIGTDLLIKLGRSEKLLCTAFVGRSAGSPGFDLARRHGIDTSVNGIGFFADNPDCCDLVFDATSASGHAVHLPILQQLGKIAIDLTPARLGRMCVPAVNALDCLDVTSVNMVTCGGQAAIPLASAIAASQRHVSYIEVVSSVASTSAGPATRQNLDEYIHTTEAGLRHFTGVHDCKAILIMNPAVPCLDMRVTVLARVDTPNLDRLNDMLGPLLDNVTRYTPGYAVIVGPMVKDDQLMITARVKGLGDFLPAYSGNLDIINCAAIATAEQYAGTRMNR